MAISLQMVAILIIVFSGDDSAMPAVPLLGGTAGLLARGLLESRNPAEATR